jgi:hypothetical protein
VWENLRIVRPGPTLSDVGDVGIHRLILDSIQANLSPSQSSKPPMDVQKSNTRKPNELPARYSNRTDLQTSDQMLDLMAKAYLRRFSEALRRQQLKILPRQSRNTSVLQTKNRSESFATAKCEEPGTVQPFCDSPMDLFAFYSLHPTGDISLEE